MASVMEQSRRELAGEYERVQKKAFMNWVNSHLLKVGQKVTDLYEDFKDGNKLLLLLELLTGVKLPREKGKMRVHKLQNVQKALDFLQKEKKIKLVNIRNDEIVDGNPKLILGLCWTLILHFQISDALHQDDNNSRSTSPQEISAKAIKEQLLSWAQMATEGYEEVSVMNFHNSWRDGMAFCAIIDRHRPDLLDYDECDPEKPLENLEKAFRVAEKELGIVRIVDPEDVCVPKPDDKAVMTYVSFLHHAFPDMPPPRKRKGPLSADEYSELYDNLRSWIEKKTDQAKSRDFPNSVDELKKEIAKLEKVISKEMPTKEKVLSIISDLHDKLKEQNKKRSTIPGVPADKEFPQLQADWDLMQKEVDDCLTAMRNRLRSLEDLEILANKIKSECDDHSPIVDRLEESVKELEENSTSMGPSETAKAASNLTREIQQLLTAVSSLENGVNYLREEKYPDVDTIDRRIQTLKSRLESLLPRVEGASHAANEAKQLDVAEDNLKKLEAWLVSNGKFSNNQHILRQIQEHKTFQSGQLSKTEEDFSRISNSPAPPGLDGKIKDMNERFQEVAKQTNDRITGLEPIVDKVLEFETLKSSLEEWCIQQQETIEQLSPLEITEEQLLKQQEESNAILEEVKGHQESLQKLDDIANQFLRVTEPVQSIADRYARRLKSRDEVLSQAGTRASEEDTDPSLVEQAGLLQTQCDWLKDRVSERSSQISDLLCKLKQFNQQYGDLQKFITGGTELLAREKPVGENATRVQEQMDTCQDFRAQIAAKQPAVDVMLSLGREILAEPNTSSASDTLMQKLTNFIQDWSDLQLNWQNWFDELHVGVEESKNLSEQLKKFDCDIESLIPTSAKLFPVTVAMKALDKELRRVQNKYISEVLNPHEAQKETLERLKSGAYFLPDPTAADEIFKKFEDLSSEIESHQQELSGMIERVDEWWSVCEEVCHWLSDTEKKLVTHKPLASSTDLIEQQKNSLQVLVDGIELHKEDIDLTLKALEDLSEQRQLLEPGPIDSYRVALERRWKTLCKEIENRIELSRSGKEHLSSYADGALLFMAWLKAVESRIEGGVTLPRSKDLLLLDRDEMKTFCDDVKVHGESLNQIELKGSSFLGCSKTYQAQLLAYQRRVDPDQGSSLPKDFVDLRVEDLTSQDVITNNFEGDEYQNGIRVVARNSASLRRRFDALNAAVKQRQQIVEECVSRRKEFDECLSSFLGSLTELEAKCHGLEQSGESQPLKVQEKVEAVRTLEVECMALEPKLQDAQAKYDLLNDLGHLEDEGVAWEGEDEALQDKEDAERRYQYLLEKLRSQKEVLNDELSSAQAFHGAFENFVTWLRTKERKIQRDDPIKLEEEDLEAGLKHLKETAADIEAHQPKYEAICAKCEELIARGVQDTEDLQGKLDNVQQRWSTIQYVSDDIEVIENTIPKLKAFHTRYAEFSSNIDSLLNKIDEFSVSAISSDGLASKTKGLQAFSGDIEKEKNDFESVLTSCGLLETPFDQSQFASDVSTLRDKMKQCDKRVLDKRSELKALEKKIRPMEDMFSKFRTWLEESKNQLSSLTPVPKLSEKEEREKVLREAQSIKDDVGIHHGALEMLEGAVGAVIPLLDESDQEELRVQLEDLTNQYNSHNFDTNYYIVERWVESKEAELIGMAPTGVQVQPLQDQLHEDQDFQRQVENYRPNMDSLSSLAAAADPTDETATGIKMKELQERYDRLKTLSSERRDILTNFLPSVQQYESSRGAWQDLLCDWEEKVEQLPPPSVTPKAIQAQMEEIKALQQDIVDHEPEFVFLKKETQKLCAGPDTESAYFDRVSMGYGEDCPVGRDLPRPGQKEQEDIIADYNRRLELLKERLATQFTDLSSQLEKGEEFESLTSELSSWLEEAESRFKDFRIHDPKSSVIRSQQQECQSLGEEIAARTLDKEKLHPLLIDLTSQLPEENEQRGILQHKLDNLNEKLSDLSNQLGQHQSNLDLALDQAVTHEEAMEKLTPWVPQTLEHLDNIGPPPTEPEKVEQLKADIEALKVEYNSLAPAYASCVENGQSLVELCEEGEPRSSLEKSILELQENWERLNKLLGELNDKLTAALIQTQEFQGIANGLDRWMLGMDDLLRQQDRIAARARLIEPQIEGFKPILSDIEAYSSTLEQASTIGESLMAESGADEKQKIQSQLSSLATHFDQLKETSSKRMSRLEEALKMATDYEDQCNQFDKWLRDIEGRKGEIETFPMASQPLKAQLERLQEFSQDVESHRSDLDSVTNAEKDLFDTELSSIELCEEHLFPTPGKNSSTSNSVLPDWLERPGASEAVGTGANLRNRYNQLSIELCTKMEEGTMLLQKVLRYESDYTNFNEWLTKERETVMGLSPPTIITIEIRQQLKEVEDVGRNFKNHEAVLESVNTLGTELVEGCKDELSGASGRLKLSDLNNLWGDVLSALSERQDKLKQGLALAENYQSLHDGFDGWLSGCEAKIAPPIRTDGDPQKIRKQLNSLKALLGDVERHRPQLDSVVTAGRSLEGYTSANPSELPDIGYTTLEDRYNTLKEHVSGGISVLDEALGQVNNLHDQLEGLLEQLEKMRVRLKGHEPPHVMTIDVEKQIKELMLLDKCYCELEPVISKCKDEGRIFTSQAGGSSNNDEDTPSGLDIQHLLSAIDSANGDVQGLLGYWRDLLASSLETAKKFENDSMTMSAWLQAKEDELAAANAVRGIPEEVQKQLEEMKLLQEEIVQHQPNMDSLSALNRSMADNSSPEDSLLLGEKQAQLVSSFESLQRSVLGRKRVLEDGLIQAMDFTTAWSDAMQMIETKSNELEQFETVGVDIDTVKMQLDEYKEFEKSLTTLKPQITATLDKGKKLKENCSQLDSPFLRDQLDKLNAAWSKLHSDGLGRKHKLEDGLLQLGQFHDALAELLTWICNCTGRLTEARAPGIEPSAVEGQIQDLQNIESGISSHTPSVGSLNVAGKNLLSSSSGENTAEVQRDLADLNKRWDTLQSLASQRRVTLNDAMEKASDFREAWKKEVDWLNEAERQAYADWKSCGLPETCEADIYKHELFVTEVKSHEELIEAVKNKGNVLKSQGTPEDKKMVDRWVGDVLKRYDDLNFILDDKKAQLIDGKARADKFDSLYSDLKRNVSDQEQVQASQEPIHSEVESVKQQMEDHKEHLKALSELENKLEELDGWGQLLIKECVTPDGEVIQLRIDDLKSRCEALSSAAIERQAALEESLLSLGQFEGAYDDLWSWLTGAMKQLEEFEPITGDPDSVATQLSKHKTLQKQVGARLSSKNAVVKAGRQVMKHKTGEDKALLKKKLQNLEKEWEKVCQVSVDRQDRLEDAYMKIGQFRSHVAPMWSWMDKVQPSLDKSEPVHGDIATVEQLIDIHDAFQRDLRSYQQNIDAANESGEHLISEVLDDPTVTKKDLRQLNVGWEELNKQSVNKQDRLDEAHRAATEFEEGYNNIMSWMDKEITELLNQSEPAQDDAVLQQQIEDNKILLQDVSTRQPEYEKVRTDCQNILQLAHPQAVPILEHKLQQMEKKWTDLKGRMGIRSEALASAELELHGLQDMLDSLLTWVSGAEGKMSESASMPIGTDIETVEQQLSNHEFFQEEMAAQQPNVDAFNKADRKRRANNPHGNPDMTKKISSLHKHWQKLWLRSGERHRQLLEAQTRLKDIAQARSFNFDKWKTRFTTWVDQQKLRVNDLFRRFDSNHDGMLTREEFMKALKASGLAMNQIELEKIADTFDKDRSGMIDLSEIISTLKSSNRRTRVPVVQEAVSDAVKIDNEIELQLSRCTCDKKFQVTRIAEGQYRFGDNQKLRLLRILRSTVMVRVGGGWEPLEEFLKKHDPCRASGRANVNIKTMLQKGPGLTQTTFGFKHASPAEHNHYYQHHQHQIKPTRQRGSRESTPTSDHVKLSPRHKPAFQTRKTPPRSAAGLNRQSETKNGSRASNHPHEGSKSSTPRSLTPVSNASRRTGEAPRSTTPVRRTGKKLSPQPRSNTPVESRVSPKHQANSVHSNSKPTTGPTQSASQGGGGRGATGSGIPKVSRIPTASKIPTPSRNRNPTKHT